MPRRARAADSHRETLPDQLAEPALHRECRMQRALGMILVRFGDAEDGHDRIASEFLDRATGASDLLGHRLALGGLHVPIVTWF